MTAFLVVSFDGGSFFAALVTGGPMRWAGTVGAECREVGLPGERDREGNKSTDRETLGVYVARESLGGVCGS